MAYAVPYLILIKCKFDKFRLQSKSKVNFAEHQGYGFVHSYENF